jgi:hypothetical protein
MFSRVFMVRTLASLLDTGRKWVSFQLLLIFSLEVWYVGQLARRGVLNTLSQNIN